MTVITLRAAKYAFTRFFILALAASLIVGSTLALAAAVGKLDRCERVDSVTFCVRAPH